MFGLKKREPLDLDAPRKPGEVEFSNLQLTRLGNWFEKKFSLFVKAMAGVVLIFLVGFVVLIARSGQQDQELEDRQSLLTSIVQDIVETRTESRVQTCRLALRDAITHNNLVYGIVTQNFTRPIPADLLKGVQRQLSFIPDCSEQGIEDLYSGKTPIVVPPELLPPLEESPFPAPVIKDGDGTTTTTQETDA